MRILTVSKNKNNHPGQASGAADGGGPGEFYHFTAMERLPGVGRAGIIKGDVPITPGGGYNAPWLTTDPSFGEAQRWSLGSFQDKQRIRLTVRIPESHQELLRKWTVLAKEKGMDPIWYEAMNKAGGGTHDSWYVYHGAIPPEWITHIEDRDDPSASENLLQKLSLQGGTQGGRAGGHFAFGFGIKTGDLADIQMVAGMTGVTRRG
jgi:hypothetical protein